MMSRYLHTIEELRKQVETFVEFYSLTDRKEALVQLGHIVNLAVRCNPRQVQGTVRKNIVQGAMQKYCLVEMFRETDPKTGVEFNKIQIIPKRGK